MKTLLVYLLAILIVQVIHWMPYLSGIIELRTGGLVFLVALMSILPTIWATDIVDLIYFKDGGT